jgi:outer membrane protein assembly factor BamB
LSPISRAKFAGSGGRILTVVGSDHAARLWNAPNGWVVDAFADVSDADVSADGRRLVTTSYNGTVLRDLESGQVLVDLGNQGIDKVALSADGNLLVATVPFNRVVGLWDLSQNKQLAVFEDPDADANPAALSGDGRMIVTALDDGTAVVWDVATRQRAAVLKGHGDTVNRAAFSADGKLVVTASDDKSARVWNAQTGAEVVSFTGHEGRVVDAAFSPDGRRVVTASDDKTVRLWDVATGRQIAVFRGHQGAVNSVAFDATGQRIVTASEDATARILEADGLREIGLGAW